ncbi:hypothetical protein [Streptomyces sp. NBC_01207]|nr:hypothetical protein OG457_06860 [Streptomyces sp. NBC_01207]
MTIDWLPDRGIRRAILALGAAGLTVIATGAHSSRLFGCSASASGR